MTNEILNKYGKYIAFAVMTFGGSALTLYSRFQMTEIEIENLEKRLEEVAKISKYLCSDNIERLKDYSNGKEKG